MYQYIRHIIRIVLLVIIITSCDSNKSEVIKGPVTLADLESKLKTGPIFIGESHVHPFARQAIIKLIKAGYVKKLFLELPSIEENTNTKGTDKKSMSISEYLSLANRPQDLILEREVEDLIEVFNFKENFNKKIKKEIPIGDLIKAALEKGGIAIYFHDMARDPETEGIIMNGKVQDVDFSTRPEGMKARNMHASEFIKKNITGKTENTVILGGGYHFAEHQIKDGATLHKLLGYGNDRVFDLTSQEVL